MNRNNTVSWVDGRVLTKLMANLQRELMEWQVFSYEAIENGKKPFGGDSSVIIEAIYLRDKLNEIIQKSDAVNVSASVDALAKLIYLEEIDNHPSVHTNRFPTWEELRLENKRKYWMMAKDKSK